MVRMREVDMASEVEGRAMKLVTDFFEKNGWKARDVSAARGVHGGYDLLLTKDSKHLTVEVKGSEKPHRGIPDLYSTQVDKNNALVADYLCVCYFPPGEPEGLAIIPREDFGLQAFDLIQHYSIKSKYKNRSFISDRLVDTSKPWLGD
jgi:hypothetical protein